MTKIKFLILFSFVEIITQSVIAKPVYLGQLKSYVPAAQQTTCAVCHGGVSGLLNPFGKDYARLVKLAPDKKSAYQELLTLDSDQDGVSNQAELIGGKPPGIVNSYLIQEIE